MDRDPNCTHCGEPIDDPAEWRPVIETDGRPVWRGRHYECAMRAVIGGVNHLKRLCTCCGGTEAPDPPHLSKRDAARLAVFYWQGGFRGE